MVRIGGRQLVTMVLRLQRTLFSIKTNNSRKSRYFPATQRALPHRQGPPKSYKLCSCHTSEVEKKLQTEQWGSNCEETTLKACSSSKLGSWSFQSPCRTLDRILLDTVLLEWRRLRPKIERRIKEYWSINRCCKQLVLLRPFVSQFSQGF